MPEIYPAFPDRLVMKNILVLSGGTGFRRIHIALVRRGYQVSRIVPVCDNGGSSRSLRDFFNLMPVGDIRHALMTQAHGEGQVGAVVRLFNWRLPKTSDQSLLQQELRRFVDGQHPLIQKIEQSLRFVILNYLQQFYEKIHDDLDLSYGCIGNFVLVGAYLAHRKDMNTAIYVFRQLCSISGNVWPGSLDNDLHLVATLEDGQIIHGQSAITTLNRQQTGAKIVRIQVENLQGPVSQPASNPMFIEAIEQADMIIYGPGSFFTSVLPHLMLDKVAQTIASRNIPRIFIANMLQDNETYGYSVQGLMDFLQKTVAPWTAPEQQSLSCHISHLLVNQNYSLNQRDIYQRQYLTAGSLERSTTQGIQLVYEDMESPWNRGEHDEDWIVDFIDNIYR